MPKELLVNVSRGEEVRVALVEEGRLEEVYLERDNAASSVGNIYLGKVTNTEASIQAAFVDFGYGRNGFLHVQDLHPDHFPAGGRWENMDERVGKKIGRRDRPPIQDCLRRGDPIVVQIIKEGIGTKGPTLTSYPSIPGRMLVAMPGVGQMGVSKNIEDEAERKRLRKILDTLEPPKDVGFIIRTAGEGKTKAEIERDFKYLVRLWQDIDRQRKRARPPALLYAEGDLVVRTVRDVWTADVDRVICDDPETALRIKQFFKLLMPRTKVDVQLYRGPVPLFHAAGVEQEIETMFGRVAPLPSGGSIVIDSTEAIVAVDVNSGKSRQAGDAEENAFRTDLEAADELCRQLRLRDLGGIVICDFIDLRYSRHRQALHDRLTEQFKRDKAKSRHLMMSEFGIVEITRQRMRPDLRKSVFMPCPWSNGTGVVKTPESLALDVVRRLRVAVADDRVARVTARLHPSASGFVLNAKRRAISEIERLADVPVEIRGDDSLSADGVAFDCFDDRDVAVVVAGLNPPKEEGLDQGQYRRRRRGGRRARAKNERQAAEQDYDVELDEDGMVLLDDLLPLGDMSLDEVEDLAQAAAKERGEAEAADPMDRILDALRDRAEDADEEEEADEEAESRSGGGRRRGRRRRRGGRDEAEVAPAAEEADEEEEEAEVVAEEVPARAEQDEESSAAGRRRRRRRRRRGSDEAEPVTAAAAEPEADDEEDAGTVGEAPPPDVDEQAEAGGGRRRGRHRGRRRRGSDEPEVSAEPQVEAEDEVDAGTVGEAPPADVDEEAEAGGGRRRGRRRRRRRSDDADPAAERAADALAEAADVLTDAAESLVSEGDDESAEPEVEPEAPAAEPEPAARRSRRRNRGRVVRNRPVAVASAAPSTNGDATTVAPPPPPPEPEPDAEAPPKKTAKKAAKKTAKKAAPKAAKKAAKKAPPKKAAKRTTRKKAAATADD